MIFLVQWFNIACNTYKNLYTRVSVVHTSDFYLSSCFFQVLLLVSSDLVPKPCGPLLLNQQHQLLITSQKLLIKTVKCFQRYLFLF